MDKLNTRRLQDTIDRVATRAADGSAHSNDAAGMDSVNSKTIRRIYIGKDGEAHVSKSGFRAWRAERNGELRGAEALKKALDKKGVNQSVSQRAIDSIETFEDRLNKSRANINNDRRSESKFYFKTSANALEWSLHLSFLVLPLIVFPFAAVATLGFGLYHGGARLYDRATREGRVRDEVGPDLSLEKVLSEAIEKDSKTQGVNLRSQEVGRTSETVGLKAGEVDLKKSRAASAESMKSVISARGGAMKPFVEVRSDRPSDEHAKMEQFKGFLTKTGKNADEKAQVVDRFLEVCRLDKVGLAGKIEGLIRQYEGFGFGPAPAVAIPDAKARQLAQSILNECVYKNFHYYTPKGYSDILDGLGLPEHFTSDDELSLKNLMPNMLTDLFRSEFRNYVPEGTFERLENKSGNHFNVTDGDRSIKIPDDGVCLFAACLYSNCLNVDGGKPLR